jgi:C4-dicarboxylate-specific signal transduction histidine kinase
VITLPDALPITLVLAILVAIFVSLQRHSPSPRVRLWTYAWALTFLHFLATALETQTGWPEKFLDGFDDAALELAGVVFLSSVMFRMKENGKRIGLTILVGAPLAAHAFVVSFGWRTPREQAGLLALPFLGAAALSLWARPRRKSVHVVLILALAGVGWWVIRQQLVGSRFAALAVVLCILYGLCGVLFPRLYKRRSLGVITVAAGFLAWAAIYPVGALLYIYAPRVQVHLDLWNVPRLFVAIGMILTLLEEKSRIVEETAIRAKAESRLLQRLSQITSRLLAGIDPSVLCKEIAEAITESSGFPRAAVFLIGENHKFQLVGWSGFTVQEVEELQNRWGRYALGLLKQFCERSARLGNNAFCVSEEENLVLIPLTSQRDFHVGCLYVSGLKDAGGPHRSEVLKLESFASEFAVMIENTRLHQQLVRSEKLAALGQLVAGVAHELNNPLTGIIGYSDLLAEEVQDERAVKRIDKLRKESRRMKRIVDGLLRFGRQNNSTTRSANLEAALRDVIQLREYHLRARGIRVDVQVEPMLPPVGIPEDGLRQVLLNILGNAIDAVEESAQRDIGIRVSSRFGHVLIQFDDSGPGFTDLGRAFEPFFTTNPVGKGTGLGLSICYGLVRECGGEITLANNQPTGASVVIDIPVAVAQPDAIGSSEPGGTVFSRFVPGL